MTCKEVYLSPKKERSSRKYGKSPKEVSFFERSITGHPEFHNLFDNMSIVTFRNDEIGFFGS